MTPIPWTFTPIVTLSSVSVPFVTFPQVFPNGSVWHAVPLTARVAILLVRTHVERMNGKSTNLSASKLKRIHEGGKRKHNFYKVNYSPIICDWSSIDSSGAMYFSVTVRSSFAPLRSFSLLPDPSFESFESFASSSSSSAFSGIKNRGA